MLSTSVAAAKPNFSSTVASHSPAAPLEGDLVTFTLHARNTGTDRSENTWIVLTWPVAGYLIAVRGLDTPQIDHEQRRVEGYVPLAAGGEHRVEVDVLTPRDSGGDTLTLGIRVSHLFSGTDHFDSHSVMVDTRVAASGVALGGLRVTPAGVAVLAWLAAFPLAWLLVAMLTSRGRTAAEANRARRWRTSPAAVTLMLMVPLAFWAMFAVMAWRDYQSLTTWRQTECTVMGRRVIAESVSSTGTGRTRSSNNVV